LRDYGVSKRDLPDIISKALVDGLDTLIEEIEEAQDAQS
jgi:hypothetical protein